MNEKNKQQRTLNKEEIEKVNALTQRFEEVIPQNAEVMTVINAAAYLIAKAISITNASDVDIQGVMGNTVHNILLTIPKLREQRKQMS